MIFPGLCSWLIVQRTVPYFHRWKRSEEHRFPADHPFAPPGHKEIRAAWKSLNSQSPDRLRQYLSHTAVDTNHVESTFFITDEVS